MFFVRAWAGMALRLNLGRLLDLQFPVNANSDSGEVAVIYNCAQVVCNVFNAVLSRSGLSQLYRLLRLKEMRRNDVSGWGLLFELALLNPGTLVSICTLCDICQGQ
jgi:hypothetical protein